jgi:hypothetical protein
VSNTPASKVVVDPKPDERGNVLALAVVGQQHIALHLNAN